MGSNSSCNQWYLGWEDSGLGVYGFWAEGFSLGSRVLGMRVLGSGFLRYMGFVDRNLPFRGTVIGVWRLWA